MRFHDSKNLKNAPLLKCVREMCSRNVLTAQSDSAHWIRIVIHLVNQFLPIENFRCGFGFQGWTNAVPTKFGSLNQIPVQVRHLLSNSIHKFHRILTIEKFNRKKHVLLVFLSEC